MDEEEALARQRDALKRAIAAAGAAKKLGQSLGVSRQAVDYWVRVRRNPVPSRYVLAIEAATGVPRHELRPDLYPPP